MKLRAISLYQPTWISPTGHRVPGRDEDEVTMAIAALRPLVESGIQVDSVVLITRSPSLIEGDTGAIIAHGVGLGSIPVQLVLGGAPAVVNLLFAAVSNTAVVATELEDRAGAGAIIMASEGASFARRGSFSQSLPLRIRESGESKARVYDDPRLLREMAWRPAIDALAGNGVDIVVGVSSALLNSYGFDSKLSAKVEAGGPAAIPFALAQLVAQDGGSLIAVEQASAEGLTVDGKASMLRECRECRDGLPLPEVRIDGQSDIPISLAAYARAFEAKLGLLAGKCDVCGTLSYPPRYRCLSCGSEGAFTLSALPRNATVYTVVTVRIPVPGIASPYSLAIVELGSSAVRVLVQVTDVPAGETQIGDQGKLVFRKIADRQGIPDYGFAFQPSDSQLLEVRL